AGEWMDPFDIKPMHPTDIEEAAEVLSRAMVSNPIHAAVYQGKNETERLQIQDKFLTMLRDRPKETILAVKGNQIIGVCRSFICRGDHAIPQEIQELLDTSDSNLSSFKDRNNTWQGTWARRDPSIRHNHLGPIGVLPAYQGLGVGTLLMENYCKLVDEQALPAYLETDKSSSVSFYSKFNFTLIDKTEILAVMNYFMWREISK
ncbi:MAG: GNAT family N-acetyltransferase, partial [Chloroflexota bacterium]